MRTQKPVHCRASPSPSEPYRYAASKETAPRINNAFAERRPSTAMFRRNARTKPCQHQGCADQPNDTEHSRGRPAAGDGSTQVADRAEWCGPGDIRRPEGVEYCAHRQHEIERRDKPNPMFRGGAAARNRRQKPSREPDNRAVDQVDFKVIDRVCDVLMHDLSL